MATKTATITISKPIKLNVKQDGRSEKYVKRELKWLSSISISGPSVSFTSSGGTKPIPHKLDVKKDKKSVTVSGSVKVKFALKSGLEDKFAVCVKKPRISAIAFFTSDDYFDNTHVDFSTEMDKPTPGVQIK